MSKKESLQKGINTQFGNGQPTNLGGAPKGKRVSTIIKELLGKKAVQFTNNKAYKELDGNTALATELIVLAFSDGKEKLSAIKEILDRIEGKPTQSVEVSKNTIKTTKYINATGS